MDILQDLLGGSPLSLVLICCCAAGVGVVLLLGLQIIGGLFDIIGQLLELFTGLLEFGPLPGCGCVIFLMICGGGAVCGLLLWQALATCGTPNAVNLCALFGG